MTRTSHSFLDATDDLQLDLMEKDIVIEQLRNQLKQLRSKLAVMEEEQAADTAPLQGLLNQLGELKVRASIRTGGGFFSVDYIVSVVAVVRPPIGRLNDGAELRRMAERAKCRLWHETVTVPAK